MKSDLKIDHNGFAGSALPNIYVRNYSISSTGLDVLCVLERYVDYNNPSSISINSLLNEVSFKFILIHDEDVANSIANRTINLSTDFNDSGMKNVSQKIYSGSEIENYNNNNILSNFATGGNKYRRKDANYNLFEELVFKVFFTPDDGYSVKEGNPDYLAVAAFPFATGKTEDTLNIQNENYFAIGNINFDVIFKNSKRVLQNQAMQNTCGDQWPGGFHKDPDGSFAGGGPNSKTELVSVTTPNFKVVDYRPLGNLIGTPNQAGEEQYDNKRAQFSNLWTSLDPEQSIRFAFAIDCWQIYLDNLTSLSGFVVDEWLKSSLMRYIRIDDLGVYRHSPELGESQLVVSSQDNSAGILNPNVHEEVAAPNSQPGLGTTVNVGLGNNVAGTLIASIREVFLSSNAAQGGINDRVRYFTGTDNSIPRAAGTYFYEVRISFQNNLDQWFENEIYLPLVKAHSDIKNYMARIETEEAEYVSPAYDRFKQRFVDTDREGKEALLARAIRKYVNTLSLVTPGVSPALQKDIANSIAVSTYPMSGFRAGLPKFLQKIQDLLTVLQTIRASLNGGTTSEGERDTHESNTENNGSTKTFMIKKFYNSDSDKIALDCLNNTGLDYVAGQGQQLNETGLAVFTKTFWRQLVANVASNYPGSDITHSYLPPSYIQSGGNTLNLYANNMQVNFIGMDALMTFRETQFNVQDSDFETPGNVLSSNQGTVQQVNQNAAADSFTAIDNDQTQNILNEGFVDQGEPDVSQEENYSASATDFGSSDNQDLNYEEEIENLENQDAGGAGSQQQDTKNAAAGLALDLQQKTADLTQINDNFSLADDSVATEYPMGSTNNQVDASILGSAPTQLQTFYEDPPTAFQSPNPGPRIDSSNISQFKIMYNLQLVKAFVGFGPAGIKDEIWQVMTPALLEQNQVLLVNLAGTYTNPDLGVGDSYESCPVFHKYFILGNPDQVRRPSMNMSINGLSLKGPITYPEFTNSLSEYLDAARPPRGRARREFKQNMVHAVKNNAIVAMPEASSEGMYRRKGTTSFNINHEHIYEVDSAGNGIAHEVCHPDHPEVCHSHRIVNWVIMPDGSAHHSEGVSSHSHSLTGGVSLRRTISRSMATRTTVGSGTRTATGTTNTGGGMSGGGGSSY